MKTEEKEEKRGKREENMRKTAKHIVQRVSTLGRPGWRFFLFNKQRRNLSRWDFFTRTRRIEWNHQDEGK